MMTSIVNSCVNGNLKEAVKIEKKKCENYLDLPPRKKGQPVETKIGKYEIGKNAKMIFEICKNAKMKFESWQKRIKVKTN